MHQQLSEPTRFEAFKAAAQVNIQAYNKELHGDGTWCYVEQVKQLESLSMNMNGRLLIYLFGEHIGTHLAEKFTQECRGNLLYFLRQLTSEYRFFILYELKNNKVLFAHC